MRSFAAGVRVANSWGVQFHPEKSSTDGRRIIENFVGLARDIAEKRESPEGRSLTPGAES